MANDNSFKTSDTPLAAFLKTQGFPLISIDYSQTRYQFHFTDSEQLQKAADSYLIGKALVDPSDFARIFKKLNRILYKKVQWEED